MGKIDRGLLLRIFTNLEVDREGKPKGERVASLMVMFEDRTLGTIDTGQLVQYIADQYDKGLTKE